MCKPYCSADEVYILTILFLVVIIGLLSIAFVLLGDKVTKLDRDDHDEPPA